MKPRVLLVAGHNGIEGITAEHLAGGQAWADRLRGGTGSHGEREWTGDFVQRAAASLNATGVIEATFTDAVWHEDVYTGQLYALVIVCHFHRDADRERAMFAAPDPALIPAVITAPARAEAQRFVERLVGGYQRATTIPVTQPLVTLNMTQLYSYNYPEAACPMLCAEWGNANLDATILYSADGMRRILAFLVACVLEHLNLMATGGVPAPVPVPPPVNPDPTYAVLASNPGDVVHEWARLYAEECARAGIRADVALAQALHETGRFTFPGLARPEWNNPAGLGVTGGIGPDGQNVGNRFASRRDGVIAHLQHLLMYFAPAHTAYCTPPTVDQRHGAHRGYPNDLRALVGTWAVPGRDPVTGRTYADAILALVPDARAILS